VLLNALWSAIVCRFVAVAQANRVSCREITQLTGQAGRMASLSEACLVSRAGWPGATYRPVQTS
jgi:hypothetical protein